MNIWLYSKPKACDVGSIRKHLDFYACVKPGLNIDQH